MATVTITNDDSVPQISIDDVSHMEGQDGETTPYVFTVSLTNPTIATVTVDYTTQDDTAVVSILLPKDILFFLLIIII